MKKQVKKSLSLLLAVIILLGAVPFTGLPGMTMKASAVVNLTSTQIKNYVESRVGYTYSSNSCLAFVRECFMNLGGPRSTACCAYKYGNSFIKSTSKDNIPVGADVFFGNKNVICSTCGNYCGHIGIYVGNGYMVHASGGKISNYRGWGYHGGINIVDSVDDTVAPTISNVRLTDISTAGYTITCDVSDNVGVTRVAFPTWTIKNDQDDLVWKDGTISGNTVTFRVNTSEHNNELGIYATHIYAFDAKNYAFKEVTIHLENEKPKISNVRIIDKDNTGYTVACDVSDNVGVTRVSFPTWTKKNDQDDIIWKDAPVSGNTAKFRVNISDHNNELGVYVTHIYAYDNCGNFSSYGIATDMIINIDSTTYKGNRYTLFESNVSWTDAKRICESLGGHLVTITSSEENNVVKALASKAKNDVWYGATNKDTNGKWTWVTGEDFVFSDWGAGEPNNLGGDQYYMQLLEKNQWDDTTECASEYQSFICEFEHTHSYTSKISQSPTCTSTGIRTYTCTQCSASYTETIAKNPSNHVGGTAVKNAKAATCTTIGYTGDTYCLGCGVITIKGAEIPAKGHGDSNNDGKCDTCGVTLGEPEKPDTPDTPSSNCSHICHKGGFIWLIIRLFCKIFKTNQYCTCGAKHY